MTAIKLDTRRYITVEGPATAHGWADTDEAALLDMLRAAYTAVGRPPEGWDDFDGDDANAVDAMIKRSPAATDDELAQRYTDYSAECYAILREPTVWSAIERVAAKLMERGKLSAAEALEAIGGDAAKLHQ